MQTIDLGTISIGGEDLGAPKRPEPTQAPRSPFPTREASRPAAPPKNTAKNAALPVPATMTSISKNARTTRFVTLETPSWRDRAAFWTLPCA